MIQITFGTFLPLMLLTGVSSFGQGIRVGPNGEFSDYFVRIISPKRHLFILI
jgi:hypothetical protein